MPTLVQHDACELLAADHIATKHLFVEYARLAFAGAGTTAAGGTRRGTDQRLALARKICRELTVHAQIEGLSGADATMDDLVSQLARAVDTHVKEERDVLFPKARAAEGLDLDALGEKMKERQQELESQAT